jgi:hypothetical protein
LGGKAGERRTSNDDRSPAFSDIPLECAARLVRARRVNCRSTLFDVANNPVFVDNEGGAAADESLFVKNAVGFDYLTLDVAEQWKRHTDVFLESLVSGVAVNADAYDLRVTFLEIGDISLIRL